MTPELCTTSKGPLTRSLVFSPERRACVIDALFLPTTPRWTLSVFAANPPWGLDQPWGVGYTAALCKHSQAGNQNPRTMSSRVCFLIEAVQPEIQQ